MFLSPRSTGFHHEVCIAGLVPFVPRAGRMPPRNALLRTHEAGWHHGYSNQPLIRPLPSGRSVLHQASCDRHLDGAQSSHRDLPGSSGSGRAKRPIKPPFPASAVARDGRSALPCPSGFNRGSGGNSKARKLNKTGRCWRAEQPQFPPGPSLRRRAKKAGKYWVTCALAAGELHKEGGNWLCGYSHRLLRRLEGPSNSLSRLVPSRRLPRPFSSGRPC